MASIQQNSLDALDAVLNTTVARLAELAAENERLRAELAEQRERMHNAGRQLRVVADCLPRSRAKVNEVNEAKAA